AQAGAIGTLDDSYLDIGLIGLRKLPLGNLSANEEAVCHGLARWAARQLPSKAVFLARWREIESLYPRGGDFWPNLLPSVIEATEDAVGIFPAADWWREEWELPPRPVKGAVRSSSSSRQFEPPAPDERKAILANIGQPLASLMARIESLMREHRRYADVTGDVFFLVRTACNVG
ncbi:MAG: hypothetical protein HQL39_12405, partial [Alphaproteobacteria bacterium]|nr:hypothetical protein [Alphaproteobacteria bacterium]